jgi:hypothetical protein
MAAFAFLPAMPREEAAAALRSRAAQLEAGNKQLSAAMSSGWVAKKPVYVNWMWELAMERAEAEIRWCERVAGLIESGAEYFPAH